MSMIEALRGVYGVEIPRVGEFHANSIGELYNNVIDLNKLDHDVVLRWWRMLRDYVTGKEDCRVFVRKLEHEQRRGFVSCFEGGLSYVFCDNSFAKVIYGLARQPYSPRDVGDFTEAMSLLKFKCLHCSHGDERHAVDGGGNRYCVYKNGTMPNFHQEWKLAHIIGVNQFYLGNYTDFQGRYFQPGELEDWAYDARYGLVVRNMGNMRNSNDRGFFISHFLRFCNPMNYFLIPNGRKVRVGVGAGFARDISEDVNLLEYIRQRRLEEFGDAWREFEECARFSGFGDIANRAGIGDIRVDFSCQPVVGARRWNGNHNAAANRQNNHMQPGARRPANIDIILDPADPVEFKRQLLQTHLARRTRVFADGRAPMVDQWRANSFTTNSNLMGNIKSSAAFRNAARDGVARLEFAIVNNLSR